MKIPQRENSSSRKTTNKSRKTLLLIVYDADRRDVDK